MCRSRSARLYGYALALVALILAALTGCSAAVPQATPTETVDAGPTLSASPTEVAEQQDVTPTAPPDEEPVGQPSEESGSGVALVYLRDGTIYGGDAWGAGAVAVAQPLGLHAWSFHEGLLATTQGRGVLVMDLLRGAHDTIAVESTGEVEFADLLWGSAGETLLHTVVVNDPAAPTYGRRVELRAFDPWTGEQVALLSLADTNGVDILRYDDRASRVLLIVRGGDPTFDEVRAYDLARGELVETLPIGGEGDAALSPDGGQLLTMSASGDQGRLLIYELTEPERVEEIHLPEGTHGVAYAWSSDGRAIACVLREGGSFADDGEGLGVWVIDVATQQISQVLDDPDIVAPLVGWTPDGEYIVGQHRGGGEEVYFVAIRPDGGDRRILNLGAQVEVLGWMPMAGDEIVALEVDPWRARFLATLDDGQAMAETVAAFAMDQADLDDQRLTEAVRERLLAAGWQLDIAGPSLVRLSDALWVAQLPPMSIYILDAGRAHYVTTGHLIQDARLEGDEFGLISGVIGASSVQPGFALWRRAAGEAGSGAWEAVWTPQGQRDWIATDGEIAFVGEGLGQIRVRGSSFGLEQGEDALFQECHACLHRWLVGTWVRQGDAYVRDTSLPEGAPLGDVLWEMTEPTPYATLHELLRRLREGLPVQGMVIDGAVLDQIDALDLLEDGVVLIPEEEVGGSVRFSDVHGGEAFLATMREGRLAAIERADR